MIRKLVGWSADHPLMTIAIWGLGIVLGVIAAAGVKFDALPDVTTNQVQILTRAPGLTPEEVELHVTRPIESALGSVPGLTSHRSISRYGLSAVTAVFEDDIDPYRARQLVAERTTSVSGALPEGVAAPELGPLSGGLGEIYQFSLSSSEHSPAELLELAERRLRPILGAIPGIIEVNTWGGAKRTFDVVADPSALARQGMDIGQFRARLEQATGRAAGAVVVSGDRQTLLRGLAHPKGPRALAATKISRSGEPVLRVGDVATVREGKRPRIGAATANGRGEVVFVMLQMLRGENAREVSKRIHAALPRVQAALPEQVTFETVYDRSRLVDGTLRTVRNNLLEGGALVIAILFLLLGSVRAGLLVALAIPVSMVGAAVAMYALNIPGNLMSLGAIDFGLLVDGSVVMVEFVFHSLRSRRSTLGTNDTAHNVRILATEVSRPVFFAVIIITIVYVPIVTMSGVDGKMFRPMALTVIFALITSLVFALTFVPAALSLFLKPHHVREQPTWLERIIESAYLPISRIVRTRRVAVAAAVLTLLVFGGYLFSTRGTELAPQLDEGDLVVQTTRAADTSLDASVVHASRVERAILRRVPEVSHVTSRIGSPAVATDTMGIEQADVFIGVRPASQWRSGVAKAQIVQEVAAAAGSVRGGDPAITQPIQMRFNELLGGSSSDVVVAVVGPDLTELRALASEIVKTVREIPGVADAKIEIPDDIDLITIEPATGALTTALNPRSLLDAAGSLRMGLDAGATYLGRTRVPIVARLPEGGAGGAIERAAIPLTSGVTVPLASVASVTRTRSPSAIQHRGGRRRLEVAFNVRGRDLGTTASDAAAAVRKRISLPPGYELRWGGQYETMQHAYDRLVWVIPGALALIIGLLVWNFGRLRPALIIFSVIPFASIGGIVALTARGMPLSISAIVGFIAVSGIAVLNGVVLLTQIIRLESQGLPSADAATQAARTRLRPVSMTALVATLGFVPMMLATGVGAEVQAPLATVVVGGLVSATTLTLFVLPALYPWFARRSKTKGTRAVADPDDV